jgi:pimeloyl-ACP methyl ester carboxylesterase
MKVSSAANRSFPTLQTQQAELSPIEGNWEGNLDAGLVKLRVILHVTKKDGTLSATLDSPDQGATGLAIDSISLNEDRVRFEMKSLNAGFEGKLAKDGSQINGDWDQGGQSLPLVFKRLTTTAAKGALHLERVEVAGHKLNMLIGGPEDSTGPTVVLEGGFGEGIAGWTMVQAEIGKFARVVSYDRAGLGQSELGPKPRSAKQIATELHTALQNLRVKPPYILVGHSLGGPFIRVFAGMYADEVAGMVLIDPSQETFDEWIREHEPEKLKESKQQIDKLPQGLRDEEAAVPETYTQARAASVPRGIPVILLTAMRDDKMSAEGRRVWGEKHKEWIEKVPGGKLVIAEKSDHFIQVREPQLVIEAIKQVLEQAKNRKP